MTDDYEPVVTRLPEALEADAGDREAAQALLEAAARKQIADDEAKVAAERAERFRRSHQ